MIRVRTLLFEFSAIFALASPALAAPGDVHVSAGRLASALAQFAEQSGVDLLFSPPDLADRQTSGVHGHMSAETALAQLLAGSGFIARRAPTGAFVIQRLPDVAVVQQAIPDIVVVGRRTQNADIRRTPNDIQPYRVASAHDVDASRTDTVDDFLRTRQPANAEIISPSQDPSTQQGSVRSEINLYGLGANQTLVLIDGLRLPGVPYLTSALLQPDINALPVGAIERIETLSGTAGGIYGPGATGGVVNVVLARAYRGASLTVDGSATSGGGGGRRRVEARLGFTPDGGNTDVMVIVSHQHIAGLEEGQRSFTQNANALASVNSPEGYVSGLFHANAIVAYSIAGPLSLVPAYGGATLGSDVSYLALNSSRNPASIGAELAAHAGQIPTGLSPDATGSERSLLSSAASTAAIASVRHRFSAQIDSFLDLIQLEDAGRAVLPSVSQIGLIGAGAPNNPFQQTILVSFPLPNFATIATTHVQTTRVTAGLVLTLPHGWAANASLGVGATRNTVVQSGQGLTSAQFGALAGGVAGPNGQPVQAPFGDFNTFLNAVQAYSQPTALHVRFANHFTDGNFHISGPVAALPGGDMTLTALIEDRREDVPTTMLTQSNGLAGAATTAAQPATLLSVQSAYAELRAPLLPFERRTGPMRGLEFQLALRGDRTTIDAPSAIVASGIDQRGSARWSTTSVTAGMRTFPFHLVMLRTSVATGNLPPSANQVGGYNVMTAVGPDPLRGNTNSFAELLFGGSLRLVPEKATTVSLGVVLNPNTRTGPRLSIDYVRIDKRNEISSLYNENAAFFIAQADQYPGRVVRAPLTAADQMAGYTAGKILSVDTTSLNIGRSRVQALDIDAHWTMTLSPDDALRLQGAGTWQPELSRQAGPAAPWQRVVGYSDGPLSWRGDAGIEWSHRKFSAGLNGQIYARYRVNASTDPQNQQVIAFQGSQWIPAQFYLDLNASYALEIQRSDGKMLPVQLRAGVTNILNHAPPVFVYLATGPGYSTHGDPRMQNFSFSLTFNL